MGNIIVGVILVVVVGLVIFKMVKDKKSGKTCCGDCCKCQSKENSGSCH